MSLAAFLAATIERLERAGVAYMVTGSVASSYHGEPRSTRDLDIVIDPEPVAINRLVAELREAGLYVDTDAAVAALGRRTQFNAIDATNGWKVDFLVRKSDRFGGSGLNRRETVDQRRAPTIMASPRQISFPGSKGASDSGDRGDQPWA